MYAVKPVLTRFDDIELSKSMYRMKSQGIISSPGDDFLDKLTKQVELIVSKVIPVVNVLPVDFMLLNLRPLIVWLCGGMWILIEN